MVSMIYEKNKTCIGNFQETILCGSGFGGGFTRGQISVGGAFLGFLSNPVNFWRDPQSVSDRLVRMILFNHGKPCD